MTEREITPEPSPEDEEAIQAALARLLQQREDSYTAWWREGVRENLELDVPPGNVIPPSGRLQSVRRRPTSPVGP